MTSILALADLAEAIGSGRITAAELTETCLRRIAEQDEFVKAWAFFDPDHARGQAASLDEWRRNGGPLGPLHGIPAGLADTIDTMDMPSEDGTPLHAGRNPRHDSTIASLLRQAGALPIGKNAVSELGLGGSGETRNPHDQTRIAGTSAAGAAAAVAAGMVPMAVGLQSGGSLIQSAAYCGVVGYKPSLGSISRAGSLRLSGRLDQPGLFTTGVLDAALLAESIMAYDPADGDMQPQAKPKLTNIAASEPPLPPRFGFIKGPGWDDSTEDMRAGFQELAGFLGEQATETPMPSVLENGPDLYQTIFEADAAVALAHDYEQGKDKLSARAAALIERGNQVLAADYIRAKARIRLLEEATAELFKHYDAILTLAAPGEAPRPSEAEDGAAFSPVWSLMGGPAISLPLLAGANGLPLGVQLVGQIGEDAKLLRTAHWLANLVAAGKSKPRTERKRNERAQKSAVRR
jgi:Asp-tRNA(Asn)/Glu-tRNA(Gln) amidotransferase A subunit family amidase